MTFKRDSWIARFFFSFSPQVRGQKGIVPLTDRNQATPRGSLCWGRLLQVPTCWKQKILKGSFRKALLHTDQSHRRQGCSVMPVSLRMGVSLLEKSGLRFGLCKVLCHNEDAELLLLPRRITNIQGTDVFKNIWIIDPAWSKTTCIFIRHRASRIPGLLLHGRVTYTRFHPKMPPCRGCRATGLPARDEQPTPLTLHIHPAYSSCLPQLIWKNVSETADLKKKMTLKLKGGV